jgi:hypothetical protein
MSGARFLQFLALGVLTGCGADLAFVDPEQVLQLTACPEGASCEKVADGRSRITVEACVPESVHTPRADALMSLTLSAGQWEGMTAAVRTVTASIKTDPCFRPTLVTGTSLSTLRIDAELQGVRRFIEIPMQPATLAAVDLVPAPLQPKAGQETQLQVQVQAANDGQPTLGTRVEFEVTSVEPATASVAIWPSQIELDTQGKALGRLLPSSAVTKLTLEVRAVAPGAASSVPALERTFTLAVSQP